MRAIALMLRAETRRRWRAWLALAIMFGIGAGAGIAAITGARRTETAYPRLIRTQDGFHAITGGGGERGFVERYELLKKHPAIASFTELVTLGPEIILPTKGGRPKKVIVFPDVVLATDPSGRALYETNRAKVVHGRLADRSRLDEAMVPFTVAERYGIELGERIVGGVGIDFESFPPAPVERVPLRVVGITAAPGDFEAVGQPSFFAIYATPALYEKYRELIPRDVPDLWSLGVHLRGGPAAAKTFKQTISRDLNIDVPIVEPVILSGVQKTIRLYAVALWLLGALVVIATLLIVGQTLARQQLLESAEYPAFRALGASRRQLVGLGMMRAGLICVVSAGVATIVAYLLSPLTPIGPARIAEPDPGLMFDAAAVGIGAAAILVLVPLIALIPSLRAARSAAGPQTPAAGAPRPSWIVSGMTQASRSPATAVGLRMALEPGRGRTAVPIRSTILAVALGIAAVTASVVVGRSLGHLLERPELAGFTYDAIILGDPEEDAQRTAQLRRFPFIDRMAVGTALNVVFGGEDSFLIAFDDQGGIGYALIDGRAPADTPPRSLPEIAIGPATIGRLGLMIGDTVAFGYPDPDQEEAEEEQISIVRRLKTQRARIVGVAAIPTVPWEITEPGEGAVMTRAAVIGFNANEGGGCCFVSFKEGTDLEKARKELEAARLEVSLRTERTDLLTLERISGLPTVLSVIFWVIAAAALAHVMGTAIRRRRRDLAILKTLGFVKGQVRGAVAWQASAIAVLSVAVGIPAGIVIGRWGWRLVADQFGVVPVPVAPVALLALVVPAALLLANLVAAIPGRVAARTQPALVLRTE